MAWVHRLLEIDSEARRGVCAACGPTWVKRNKTGKLAGGFYWKCGTNEQRWRSNKPNRGSRDGYRRHKTATCERCGFVPEHPCQLDVDHINGDHSDSRPENLRTLCANCHRLTTRLNGHGVYARMKSPERSSERERGLILA